MIKAKKTPVDGIIFDSIYESEVYRVLKEKLSNEAFKICSHYPVQYTGIHQLSGVHSSPSWKVDFLIERWRDHPLKARIGEPFFAIEAKGRFMDSDKFKFIMWDIFQRIPLLVVYQGKLPKNLSNSGWVSFVHEPRFKRLNIEEEAHRICKKNEWRKERKISF